MNPNLKITGLDPPGVSQGNTVVYLALGNSNGLKEKMHILKVSESRLSTAQIRPCVFQTSRPPYLTV